MVLGAILDEARADPVAQMDTPIPQLEYEWLRVHRTRTRVQPSLPAIHAEEAMTSLFGWLAKILFWIGVGVPPI